MLLNAITGSIAWWVDNLRAFFAKDRQAKHEKVMYTVVARHTSQE